MTLDSIQQRIESGAAGFVASIVGFASVFLACIPPAFIRSTSDPRWQLVGATWYFAMVGILCIGCPLGVVFSLLALKVRSTRLARLGLLFGCMGLLFAPTYLLPVFRLVNGK
jgi:hypothetical protein